MTAPDSDNTPAAPTPDANRAADSVLTETGTASNGSAPANSAAPATNGKTSSINIERVGPASSEDSTASQSLADALKTSFLVLKVGMLLLVIAYLFSGFVRINSGEAGVRVRLGKALPSVLTKPQLVWPFPFEQVVRVRTAPIEAKIETPFYYANPQGAPVDDLKFRIADLDPQVHGSLIAADGGIVHAKARVLFSIEDPVNFVKSVGLAKIGTFDSDGNLITDDMVKAHALVNSVVEQTMVELAAKIPSDNFYRGSVVETARDIAQRLSSEQLTPYGIRLDLNSLTIKEPAVSPSVKDAYQERTNAESERAKARSAAQQQASRVMTETAGSASKGLMDMIDVYEKRKAEGDEAGAQEAFDAVITALRERQLPEAYGSTPITGLASQKIADAEANNSQYLARIRQEVDRFLAYVNSEGFQENPSLAEARLASQFAAELFSGELAEIFVLPEGNALELWLNRDPSIVRQLEQKRLEEEAANAAGAR